ncbi:diphosphomevalonate decarboxylase [Candidatus Bathyarchaeota archaeon]|nr:diphosphomevalonate decarboxylase [Candidatus Bathyarchaeota archaeon]
MKCSARAYAIQGLIKYHGLKDPRLRIPFHDSISVCMKALDTVTTVEVENSIRRDNIRINGSAPTRGEEARALIVIDKLRALAGEKTYLRVESENANVRGKGLGFSASGFAALGLATSSALGLKLELRELSEIVRLGAGSAARSLVGGFSIWYANRGGHSYAEQLASAGSIAMRTLIVPIPSSIKTDKAHAEVLTSPFFRARLDYVRAVLRRMRRAITRGAVSDICRLAEMDTLNLHAITMTGKSETILVSPLSIRIMEEVRKLREEENLPVWFSLDTGPSVFINTAPKALSKVVRRIRSLADHVIVSEPAGPAETISQHLF